MRCQEVANLATDYIEGAIKPSARQRVEAHLAECADCRAQMAELKTTGRALRAYGQSTSIVSTASKEAALSAFLAWQAATDPGEIGVSNKGLFAAGDDRPQPRFVPAMLIAGLAAVIGGLGAHHYAEGENRWLVAIVLAGAACGLIALSHKHGRLAAGLAVGSATLFGAFGSTNMQMPIGTACGLHELITAGLTVAAFVLTRRNALLSQPMLMGVAAAGALAGDATLHIVCPGAESFGHVLVFHVGGIVVAGLLLGMLTARILGPTRVAA